MARSEKGNAKLALLFGIFAVTGVVYAGSFSGNGDDDGMFTSSPSYPAPVASTLSGGHMYTYNLNTNGGFHKKSSFKMTDEQLAKLNAEQMAKREARMNLAQQMRDAGIDPSFVTDPVPLANPENPDINNDLYTEDNDAGSKGHSHHCLQDEDGSHNMVRRTPDGGMYKRWHAILHAALRNWSGSHACLRRNAVQPCALQFASVSEMRNAYCAASKYIFITAASWVKTDSSRLMYEDLLVTMMNQGQTDDAYYVADDSYATGAGTGGGCAGSKTGNTWTMSDTWVNAIDEYDAGH